MTPTPEVLDLLLHHRDEARAEYIRTGSAAALHRGHVFMLAIQACWHDLDATDVFLGELRTCSLVRSVAAQQALADVERILGTRREFAWEPVLGGEA